MTKYYENGRIALDCQAAWLFFMHLAVCLLFPQESPWINIQRIYVIFLLICSIWFESFYAFIAFIHNHIVPCIGVFAYRCVYVHNICMCMCLN